MANCVIYQKGTDIITYFVKDCIQEGNNFYGSNIKLRGIKLDVFDIKWTNEDVTKDEVKLVASSLWNKKVSEVTEGLYFNSVPVSNRDDVDKVTVNRIREKYTENEEFKLLRMKIEGTVDEKVWNEYNLYVETMRSEGTTFKDANFPAEIIK